MLKKSLFFASLILTFGLLSSPQVSLAAEIPREVTNSESNFISQPLRLEISLRRRRVTVYSENRPIKSYPIAIGRAGWRTPTGNFQVMQMLEKPGWINPLTGQIIPGGTKENPLGKYWIGFWTDNTNWIGFHGTPNPESVGKEASHGCIRMYNKDVEELFYQVSLGTPVTVVP